MGETKGRESGGQENRMQKGPCGKNSTVVTARLMVIMARVIGGWAYFAAMLKASFRRMRPYSIFTMGIDHRFSQ